MRPAAKTALTTGAARKIGRAFAADVPHGRMGRAEDLTGIAISQANDEANSVVFQCYNVNGGPWTS